MSKRTFCEQLLSPDNDLCQGCFWGLHLLHLSWLALTLALASKGDCHTWLPVARTVLGPVPHLPVSVLCRRPPPSLAARNLYSLSLSATLLHKLLSPSTTLEGATGAIITLWCQIRQASYCGRAHSQSLWRPETWEHRLYQARRLSQEAQMVAIFWAVSSLYALLITA